MTSTEAEAVTDLRDDTVLVLGGSGQVGSALVANLIARGGRVIATRSRLPDGAATQGGRVRWTADLATITPGSVRLALSAMPLPATAAALPALAALGVTELVAMSSVGIPQWQSTPADLAKAEAYKSAEAALLEAGRAGPRASVLRTTMIFGQANNRNLLRLARTVRRWGAFAIAGDGAALRQPLHVDDLFTAMLAAAACPGSQSELFEAGGAERLSYRALVERVFAALGRPPRIVHVPVAPVLAALRLGALLRPGLGEAVGIADRMGRDLVADNARAASALGFAPRGCDLATLRAAIVPHLDGAGPDSSGA